MKKTMKQMAAVLMAGAMVMGLSLNTFAAEWKQDQIGWWVAEADGSYLVNQWYQDPASGLWYYMGADGYMLTNTTTPDGYYVNADGVWVQDAAAAQTTETAVQVSSAADTSVQQENTQTAAETQESWDPAGTYNCSGKSELRLWARAPLYTGALIMLNGIEGTVTSVDASAGLCHAAAFDGSYEVVISIQGWIQYGGSVYQKN